MIFVFLVFTSASVVNSLATTIQPNAHPNVTKGYENLLEVVAHQKQQIV